MSEGCNFFPSAVTDKNSIHLVNLLIVKVGPGKMRACTGSLSKKPLSYRRWQKYSATWLAFGYLYAKTFQNLPVVNHALPLNWSQKKLVVNTVKLFSYETWKTGQCSDVSGIKLKTIIINMSKWLLWVSCCSKRK